MPSLIALLSLATLSLAITVSKPSKYELWDSSKSNTIVWSSVSTDPQTVDIYLTHMAAHPPLNSLLFANVATSDGKATVSGLQLPTGEAYQINLVAHDKPEQIYAQSQQFNVTGEAVAATKTLDGYTGPTHTPSSSSSSTSSARTTLSTVTTTSSSADSSATSESDSETSSSSETASATESDSAPSQTESAGNQTSGSSTPTATPNAAAGNSAPIAALVFGVAAFFL